MAADTADDVDLPMESGAPPPDEDKEEFFRIFRAEQLVIREALEACSAGDAAGVHEQLDGLLARVQALEASFTRIAHALPRYDVQKYREMLRDSEVDIGKRREQLAPRKKFSFTRKKPAATGNSATPAEAVAAAPPAPSAAAAPASAAPPAAAAFQGELFEGLNGQSVVRGSGELAGRDVTLRSLRCCRVVLLDRIGALHCHDLQHCEVVVGAVGSSSLLYGIKDCSLTLAGKQFRLHDAERVALQLHTLSNPVIEHSKRVLLSPYDLWYPDVEVHWTAADLGSAAAAASSSSAGDAGPWADMQDFDWHKRQASPNWRLVPALLRRPRLELDGSVGQASTEGIAADLELLFERCIGLWEQGLNASAENHGPVEAAGQVSGTARLEDEDEF